MKLLFGTGNPAKLSAMRNRLRTLDRKYDIELIGLKDLKMEIPSKLQWRHLALGGNEKIQRPMHAQLKKAKAMVSTKVKSRKSLSRNYWKNIRR